MPDSQSYDAVIEAPFGRLGIVLRAGRLKAIDFLPASAPLAPPQDAAAQSVAAELRAYFLDGRHRFRLPVDAQGTPFQRRVWAALQAIGPGQTRTYGQVAAALGSAPRAVGGACRANPVPLVIPCHRVVANTGVGGFAGSAAEWVKIKRWLLTHEEASRTMARAIGKK